MFTEAELSQKKIDVLLELWAATLIPHGDSPPIANHQHLHRQIDAIKLGNTSWENTTLKYEGPLPETTRPAEWKTTVYDVWYRNPREVIKNIFASTDLNGHIDYAAYQEFSDEKRQYGNVMSGDWSWRQSVRSLISDISSNFTSHFTRIPFPRTHRPTVPCLSQLSLDPTRQLSPLLLAKTTTIRYISRSAMFKIIFDVRTKTRWY